MRAERRRSERGRASRRRGRAVDVALIVVFAALIRLPALFTDLWFDEILSLERYARSAGSISDIFFAAALKHDNNHHLNTLALYWIGDQARWVVYRLPAFVCGLVGVAAVVLIGRRRSRLEGLACGGLVAASYMMSVYSTEARGYSWLLAFVALAFLALDRFLASGSRPALVAFWIATGAGLAAHPAILHFHLGAVLWSGFRLRLRPMELARLYAVPALWIVAWAVVVTRGSIVGGGPPWTWGEIVDQSLAWTFGYPAAFLPWVVSAAAAGGLVLWDARRLWLEGSDEGLFYIGVILGPVVFLAALSPPYLFPRYLLVPLLFLLVVAGRRLASWSRSGRWQPAVCALAAGALLLGNGVHIRSLARERQGNHTRAVQEIARSASDAPALVTSPSLDDWTELPLRFYGRALGLEGRIAYVPRANVAGRSGAAQPITWIIEPAQPCTPESPTVWTLRPGQTYDLDARYPVCGPSGMSWSLYSRSR
jgi:hypothetical protein